LFWARIQGLFGSGYELFNLGVLGQFCMLVSSAHKGRSIRVTFKNYLNTYNLNFDSFEDNYFWIFHFNMWEWFLHSSVLEQTESDLSKINWLRGVILLNPIVLVPWGRFSLCHTPIRPISAFRDQVSILIVGCVTTWSRGSHQ
jgi:hypothetical protein